MDADGPKHDERPDKHQTMQRLSQSNVSSLLPPQPSQTITGSTPGSGIPKTSSFVIRPFSARLNRTQVTPSILTGRSPASFASSLPPRGPPVRPSFRLPYTPPPGPSPPTPTTPITSTSRAISTVTIDGNDRNERSATTLSSTAIDSSVQNCATKTKAELLSPSSAALDQQMPYPYLDPHEHDAKPVQQLDPFAEDKSLSDTATNVADENHGSHPPKSGAVGEPCMNTLFVPRPEQNTHEANASLQLELNMEEQEPSAYYAGWMQCIDKVTKSYRDTISRQNHKLFELESSLSHERGRLCMVEDVGLALKEQNETILAKNIQLEKEVSQLQTHKAFKESRVSELSKEITLLQDKSNGLKDSTMEKVVSLKASCLEACGDLGKLREHVTQYGEDIQVCHMSLEQWQAERDSFHKSLSQAIENTCGIQRQQVRAMAELQRKYECVVVELGNFQQRSESYASVNEKLQQSMQQLGSDHQNQMLEMASTNESLENEVRLLTMAKDHQHCEFEAQIASVEALLHGSLSSLDQTKRDLDRTKLDLSNAETIKRVQEERIRNLEEQVRKPETRTVGVSTKDDASFDLHTSYYALQGQYHAHQSRIDALQVQNRTLQGQIKAVHGDSRALLGQNNELLSQADGLRGKISDLEGQIQRLSDERDCQNEKIEALEQASLTYEQTSVVAENLLSDIRALKNDLEASIAELSKQQEKVRELTSQLVESENKRSELKAELKASQSKVQGFHGQFEDYRRLHEVESQNAVKQLQSTIQSQKELLEARAKEVGQLNQSILDTDKVRAELEAWKQDQMTKNQDDQAHIQQLKMALGGAQSRLIMQATTSVEVSTSPMPLTDIARTQDLASSWTDFLKWPTDVESSLASMDADLLHTSSIGTTGQDVETAQSLEHHLKEKATSTENKRSFSVAKNAASADKENSAPPQEIAPNPTNLTQVEASRTTKAKGVAKGKCKTVVARDISPTNKDEDNDDDDFEKPLVNQPRKYVKRQARAAARRVASTGLDTETGTACSNNTLSSPNTSMSSPDVGKARKRSSRSANK